MSHREPRSPKKPETRKTETTEGDVRASSAPLTSEGKHSQTSLSLLEEFESELARLDTVKGSEIVDVAIGTGSSEPIIKVIPGLVPPNSRYWNDNSNYNNFNVYHFYWAPSRFSSSFPICLSLTAV